MFIDLDADLQADSSNDSHETWHDIWVAADVGVEEGDCLHHSVVEALSLNGELKHLEDSFFSVEWHDAVFVDLFEIVICFDEASGLL